MANRYLTFKRVEQLLLLLGMVLLLVWSAHLAHIGLSLWGHLCQAQALADVPESVNPAAACSLVQDLRGDVMTLRREIS